MTEEPNYAANFERNKEEIIKLFAEAVASQYKADFCGQRIVDVITDSEGSLSQVEMIHSIIRDADGLPLGDLAVNSARISNDPCDPSFLDKSKIESWCRKDLHLFDLLSNAGLIPGCGPKIRE